MPTTRLIHTAAAALAIGALIAPAAHGMPAQDGGGHDASAGLPKTAEPVVTKLDPGFDWASAALGAGAGALVVSLLAAGGMTAGRRTPPRPAR